MGAESLLESGGEDTSLALHLFLRNQGHHKLFPVSCSQCGNTPLFSVFPQARRVAQRVGTEACSSRSSFPTPTPAPHSPATLHPPPPTWEARRGLESPYCLHPSLLSEASACSSLVSRVKQAFLKHSSSPTSTGCLEDTSKHLSGILSPLCYDSSPRHAVLPVSSHALFYALSFSLTAPLPCLSGCQSHVTCCFLTSNVSSSTFKGCDIFFLCRGLPQMPPFSWKSLEIVSL